MPSENLEHRMQVVKGFSEFSFEFLKPNLPPCSKRLELEAHWPKWYGDRWRFYYSREYGPSLARFELFPSGKLRMILSGSGAEKTHKHLLGKGSPYELFSRLEGAIGKKLIRHLRKYTRKSSANA